VSGTRPKPRLAGEAFPPQDRLWHEVCPIAAADLPHGQPTVSNAPAVPGCGRVSASQPASLEAEGDRLAIGWAWERPTHTPCLVGPRPSSTQKPDTKPSSSVAQGLNRRPVSCRARAVSSQASELVMPTWMYSRPRVATCSYERLVRGRQSTSVAHLRFKSRQSASGSKRALAGSPPALSAGTRLRPSHWAAHRLPAPPLTKSWNLAYSLRSWPSSGRGNNCSSQGLAKLNVVPNLWVSGCDCLLWPGPWVQVTH